jgi:tetratricopeptide (TPR) repeat protein
MSETTTPQEGNPKIRDAFQLYRDGDLPGAEALCLEGLKESPQEVAGMRLLGTIARETERPGQAVDILGFALKLRPTDPYIAGELAASLVLAERAPEATPILEQLVRQLPEQAISHYWLGRAYLAQFYGARAAKCFRTAYELDPNNDNILHMIGIAFLSAGRGREAEPWLREYFRKHQDSSVAHFDLSVALQQQVRLEEAATLSQRAVELDPDNAPAIAALARFHRTYNRYDEALRLVTDGMERLGPHPALAAVFARLCERDDKAEEGVRVIREILEGDQNLSSQRRVGLYFGLGRLEERLGNHDRAWDAFTQGNMLFPSLYNAQSQEILTEELRNTFNAWTLTAMPKATIPTDKPVFVVGMPRSGTTLVEQILSSHPECFGAGELLTLSQLAGELGRRLGGRWPTAASNITPELANEFAGRYLEHIDSLAPEAARVVDKLPHNFRYIGLMSVLFPGARVIHCIRSPLDVCVSNYGTPLSPQHTWRPRLETLAHAYNEYRKIMDHWRADATIPILDVVYEDSIADIESQARRIVEFAGLPWDDRCLKFYEHSRAVMTASTDQVRRPIYQSSKERWRRYEQHLGPLIEGLKAGGTNIEQPFRPARA